MVIYTFHTSVIFGPSHVYPSTWHLISGLRVLQARWWPHGENELSHSRTGRCDISRDRQCYLLINPVSFCSHRDVEVEGEPGRLGKLCPPFRIKSPSGKHNQACIYWFPASQTDQIHASPPFRLFVKPIASGPNLHLEGGKDAPWLGQACRDSTKVDSG